MRRAIVGRGSKRYKEWKKGVLERDGNICISCGNDRFLHCDHIKPWKEFPEFRFNLDNGQTLCAGCHLKKGRENKEITNDVNTRFKKGQLGIRKGIKTGKPAWNAGKKLSEEQREKLSKAAKKRYSEGFKVWNDGKKHSEESRLKMSIANKGRIPWNKSIAATEEQREKCRMANLGKNRSPETQFKKGLIPWNKKVKL